jgi:hypothetical protein
MASKLDLILTQVEKLNDRFEKSEAKQDIRFEVTKNEFQLVRSEMTEGFAVVRTEFVAVRKDLSIVRDQTAHVTERMTALEQAQTPPSH